MEIEFALPNELKTVEQYRQIIDAFIDKHLKNHYFAYAIHDKIGAMSNGQHHPHVHIMFSERMIDEVEKIQERKPQYFFKYPVRQKKELNTVRQKIAVGLINLFFRFFVPILPKFKMMYLRKMVFLFVSITAP